MNRLYYVTGYHWKNNQRWRFAVTAPTQEDAADKVAKEFESLSEVAAVYVCTTPEQVFVDL